MRKLYEQTRLAVRESKDLGGLLTMSPQERAVVVYAEDSFTHIQLQGYLDALFTDHGIRYQYVTSDPRDPVLENTPEGATTWYVRNQLARLLGSLECEVFLTTMPDLGRFHIPPPKAGKTVYAFHSLNSTHTAYRTGAFDSYDAFFCTGPHHVEELRRLRTGLSPELFEVGYHKLDLIRSEHGRWKAQGEIEGDRVLLAPSWGRENLLEAHGREVISSILAAGLRVIVRPHPQFFHSLYPQGAGVIDRLQDEFGDHEAVEFELSIDSQDSFHRSALMVSDWSGAAYEYAFGTLRPVIFVDTPQKIFNPDWETLRLPSFERVMRHQVGHVVPRPEVSTVGDVAQSLVSGDSYSSEDLDRLAESVVFNLDESAGAGAEVLAKQL